MKFNNYPSQRPAAAIYVVAAFHYLSPRWRMLARITVKAMMARITATNTGRIRVMPQLRPLLSQTQRSS